MNSGVVYNAYPNAMQVDLLRQVLEYRLPLRVECKAVSDYYWLKTPAVPSFDLVARYTVPAALADCAYAGRSSSTEGQIA